MKSDEIIDKWAEHWLIRHFHNVENAEYIWKAVEDLKQKLKEAVE
jgi:hypothetical protein